VWVLLWGSPSVGNVAAGLVLGTVLVVLVAPGPDRRAGLHPLAVVRYGVHFAWALTVATASVVRTVLSPRMRLAEAIVAVPMRAVSPVVVAFVANSITLTPGTLTVDVRPRHYAVDDPDGLGAGDVDAAPIEPPVLYVHCLVLGDPEQVRADARAFEARAVAAFGTPEDRRAVLGAEGVR